MRNELVNYIEEKLNIGASSVAFLTGDLGFSVLEKIQNKLGKAFINAGVAEANMTSIAAALADEGYKVFTYSITPFATFRCLEQIRNDICYHGLDVTVIGVGVGFDYGGLGPTHHSTEDLAALWSLPRMQVFSPGNLWELDQCMDVIWHSPGPKYIRVSKGGSDIKPMASARSQEELCFEYGLGSQGTIVCTGLVLGEVMKALGENEDLSKKWKILSFARVKPFPSEVLLRKIEGKQLLVVDETNPYGGFSSQVCRELLIQNRHFENVKVLNAQDKFAEKPGTAETVRSEIGVNAKVIASALYSMED